MKSLPLLLTALTSCVPFARAQWVTENYPLKAGWNAVWLVQDAGHDSIDNHLAAYPNIVEIWRWNTAASTAQFTQSPAQPVQPDTQWLVWRRGFPADSTLAILGANSAYLVKVADAVQDFTLSLTGRPVPPRYAWSSTGMNFFGFPMKTPDSTADRNFERFLGFSGTISAGPDIFFYNGGPIESNPAAAGPPRLRAVSRGLAYWIRSTQYSDYYGPVRVSCGADGLSFGDAGSTQTLRVKNVTAGPLNVTLSPAASQSAPAGQPPVAGQVPLRLRGALNPQTGQFTYTTFTAPVSRSLAAGEEAELIFTVDRALMGGAPGSVFQSLLRVEDSLNISAIDLPVSAVTTSRSGLWVGTALINKVDQITAAPANPAASQEDGTTAVNTHADAGAPSEFPIRLIFHRSDSGELKLIQRAFLGESPGGAPVVAVSESALNPAKLAGARRLSSASFPLKLNESAAPGGDLGLSGSATFEFMLDYKAATNPFVHAYHPDHDNKDAEFSITPVPEGKESFSVTRNITLTFASDPSALGLVEPAWGSTVLGGSYEESITGLRAQAITVKGAFVIRRLTDLPILGP